MTTAASFAKGPQRTQSARLAAAIFKIRQARKQRRTRARPPQRPLTDLVMQTPRGLGRACASTNSPTVTPIKGVVRSLSGSGKGLFRTIGGGSTTTITNGTWIVNDRCDGTLTQVGRGTATVFDAGRHRTVRVRAGQAYLAKARLFAARTRRGHRLN